MASTITRQNLKILKSENISDFADGGGRVTANEVQDGSSNDLFLDVPDTSRAYGDIDLVKVFPALVTDNSEPLLGAVMTLGKLPADPSVNVTLFTTKDWFDRRSDAQNALESYLAPAPKVDGHLFEKQLKGQKAIQLIMEKDGTPPAIGKSLYLVENEGAVNSFSQYVMVTALASQVRTFTYKQKQVTKKVVTLEISTKLDYTFTGATIAHIEEGLNPAAFCRETRVTDTANYYTTKALQADVTQGQAKVKVDDIFTQLVPSARSETGLSGINAVGKSTTLVPTGKDLTVSITNYQPSPSADLFMGNGIYPNTLKIQHGSDSITDKGGELLLGGNAVGAVDYKLGVISWLASYSPARANISITFKPTATPSITTTSFAMKVTEANRGFTYTRTLLPVPVAGTLQVSYIAQGNNYALQDKGAGELLGLDSSFGTGTINYDTGDTLVSLGAEPDVDSYILYTWATQNGLQEVSANASDKLAVHIPIAQPTTANESVQNGSISVAWNDGAAKTANCDGRGVLTGDATGKYNHDTGVLTVEPNQLPPKNTVFNVSYKLQQPEKTSFTGTNAVSKTTASTASFTLPLGGKTMSKGSLKLKVPVHAKLDDKQSTSGSDDTPLGKRDMYIFDVEDATNSTVGKLYFNKYPDTQVGTITYASGLVNLDISTVTELVFYTEYSWD